LAACNQGALRARALDGGRVAPRQVRDLRSPHFCARDKLPLRRGRRGVAHEDGVVAASPSRDPILSEIWSSAKQTKRDAARVGEHRSPHDHHATPAADDLAAGMGHGHVDLLPELFDSEGDASDGSQGVSVGRAVYEVVRIDRSGKTRRLYLRRRDLIRQFDLLPRDLRRIDPTLSVTRTSPTLMPREKVLLVNVAGVRLIITADTTLVFEPSNPSSQRYIQTVLPKLGQQGHDLRRTRHTHLGGHSKMYHDGQDTPHVPFDLEMMEGALVVATNKLDGELVSVSSKVSEVLGKLITEATPLNLDELRRIKSSLVELESRAETLVQLLEEVLDDVDELRDFNLSSRPVREEKRRLRERERLERERDQRAQRQIDERWALSGAASSPGMSDSGRTATEGPGKGDALALRGGVAGGSDTETYDAEVDDAIQQLEDAEIEEQELEEVEDLLEYYMQRAASTQSEAERLLASARDMEESIAVSLSARRLAVIRLELMLSIGSFAAAIGACVSGIFGMNLRSKFEESTAGFYGVSLCIVAGCAVICWLLWRFAKKRKIL